MSQSLCVAVIGHTSGVGRALFEAFQKRGDRVRGFSRQTGHDLYEGVEEIVAAVQDCDLLIHNAFAYFYNTVFLYQMHELWRDQEKVIVNISSDSGDGTKDFPHMYAVAKSALDKASEQLQNCPGRLKIINIRPGYIDTPRVGEIEAPKLRTSDLVETVMWCLERPPQVYIREISLRAHAELE